MTVTVNIENIPLLREPIDRARAEGFAEGRAEGRTEGFAEVIQRLLERRFPGQVPDGLVERLTQLGPVVIDEVGTNLLTGETIEEVLGRYILGRASDPCAAAEPSTHRLIKSLQQPNAD